jgi:hypothetical protein
VNGGVDFKNLYLQFGQWAGMSKKFAASNSNFFIAGLFFPTRIDSDANVKIAIGKQWSLQK